MPRRVIGLLGGSFDPIHAGHLQLGRDALAALPLDELRLVPAAQPWQKGPVTPATHRLRMIELAIAAEPRFTLDGREVARGGQTYTIDTLRALRAELPDASLVLIMGSDQFVNLNTWREWQAIGDLAHVAVADRANAAAEPGPAVTAWAAGRRCGAGDLAQRPAGCVVDFPMTPVAVSATEIRYLAGSGTPDAAVRLRAVVPPAVLDYIHANRLYA